MSRYDVDVSIPTLLVTLLVPFYSLSSELLHLLLKVVLALCKSLLLFGQVRNRIHGCHRRRGRGRGSWGSLLSSEQIHGTYNGPMLAFLVQIGSNEDVVTFQDRNRRSKLSRQYSNKPRPSHQRYE